MSPTNIMMQPVMRYLVVVALAAGCGGSGNETPDAAPDAPTMCMANPSAPTYTQLYTRYFGPSTEGHCSNDGCHGSVNFNIWSCGDTKADCYTGMVGIGLINTSNPVASRISDSRTSPLSWVNPNGGFMPQDNLRAFPEGRDAILAWVAACAQNN